MASWTDLSKQGMRESAKSGLVHLHRPIGATRTRLFGRRRVLLLAQTPMMANVLIPVWGLLAPDFGLEGWLSMPNRFDEYAASRAAEVGLQHYRRYRSVRRRWWDLVLLADHATPFDKSIKTVLIPHGMTRSSKVVDGSDYAYGKGRIVRGDGTPVYSLILEQSEQARSDILREFPQLEGHITAVGDLRVDQLLGASSKAAEAKSRLGFEPTDRVVAIMSTFGPHSLVERFGKVVFNQITEIADGPGNWRFVVASHPNLWSSNTGRVGGWDDYLLSLQSPRLRVLEPGEDFTEALGAADLALTDHTSLSVGFAITGKPVVYLEPPQGAIAADSPVAQLADRWVRLTQPGNLGRVLADAIAGGLDPDAAAIAGGHVSHLGMASQRVPRAIRRLLYSKP